MLLTPLQLHKCQSLGYSVLITAIVQQEQYQLNGYVYTA